MLGPVSPRAHVQDLAAADGGDFLLCASNEVSAVEDGCHCARVATYVEFARSPINARAEILRVGGYGAATIGIEKRYLMGFYEELLLLLPQARFVAGDRAVEAARAVKLPEHIALIVDASRATERALAAAFAAARPGATERALAASVVQAMFDVGAQVVRHAVIAVGDNARHAHPFPSSGKCLEPDDIIRADIGGLFGGYGTDIARMAAVGPPNAAQTDIYDNVRGCVQEVGAGMRAGMRACDVYRAAVAYYAGVGIPDYCRDHVGHSLSILGGQDNSLLHDRNDHPLEPGMVIALEPIQRDSAGRRIAVEDCFEVGIEKSIKLTTVTATASMTLIG